MKNDKPSPAPLVPDFDVRSFGATGDGVTDDTAAIQSAIDAAAERGGGGVWLPPGQYAVRQLQLRSYVGLFGHPTWTYHQPGGTSLRLIDDSAQQMIDLTGSLGARVVGLGLHGGDHGEDIRGIYLNGAGHEQEDTLYIERCRISNFSGDAVRFDGVWGFTVSNNMIIFNGGDGLAFSHWDGWVYENIFNNNRGYGIHGIHPNASVSVVSNRIEWNYRGGILIENGGHYHINDNYIDRSGGPAITLRGKPEAPAHTFAITGNLMYRSGARVEPDSSQSSHLLFEHVAGLVCTGNAMHVGVNDSGAGTRSPRAGIVLQGLVDSIVSQNVLHHGMTTDLLVDAGGHNGSTIIRDNIGSLAPPLT